MEWTVKGWSELSLDEIEKIFKLRSEVFVVEQNCIYQDIDGKDKLAKHVFGFEKKELIAYSRIFKPGDYFKEASFGRAVVKKTHRGKGIGDELVKKSVEQIDLPRVFKVKRCCQCGSNVEEAASPQSKNEDFPCSTRVP